MPLSCRLDKGWESGTGRDGGRGEGNEEGEEGRRKELKNATVLDKGQRVERRGQGGSQEGTGMEVQGGGECGGEEGRRRMSLSCLMDKGLK